MCPQMFSQQGMSITSNKKQDFAGDNNIIRRKTENSSKCLTSVLIKNIYIDSADISFEWITEGPFPPYLATGCF